MYYPNLTLKAELPPLPNDEKANATLGDLLVSSVSGKELASGLYKILKVKFSTSLISSIVGRKQEVPNLSYDFY